MSQVGFFTSPLVVPNCVSRRPTRTVVPVEVESSRISGTA
jgi:hypothetical protein